MRIIHDSFSGDHDLREMEFFAREFRSENLHVTDLPYRLSSWALDDPKNVHIWRDGDNKIIAWIVMQAPFDSLDFCCLPEKESTLLPDVLQWADDRSRKHPDLIPRGTPEGNPCWFINIFSNQAERIRILEDAGFLNQGDVGEYSWSKFLLQHPGSLPLKKFSIPEGFEIRSLSGEKEVIAYVHLHQETFKSRIMTYEWRKRIIIHADYNPDLDLVISAPDGRLAAFCICWLDNKGNRPYGQIEPLGCHPDFRHFALGRAILAEGIRRLHALGVEEIDIETDNWRNTAIRLYESLGFQIKRDVIVYRKDY